MAAILITVGLLLMGHPAAAAWVALVCGVLGMIGNFAEALIKVVTK